MEPISRIREMVRLRLLFGNHIIWPKATREDLKLEDGDEMYAFDITAVPVPMQMPRLAPDAKASFSLAQACPCPRAKLLPRLHSVASSKPLDLLVIGAGIYGISAANTYLSLHPTSSVLILDSQSSVGGVWSRSRLYPKFWSRSPSRLVGFYDAPFHLPHGAETYWDLFEARYVTEYLEQYVSKQVYDGRSLRERCVLGCWVSRISKDDDGVWVVEGTSEGIEVVYRCGNVIVAVGVTEIPNVPSLEGRDDFQGRFVHQKDFGMSTLFSDNEEYLDQHTNITILGGAKSAADMVYAAATDVHSPRKVSWIIRKSGLGPLLLESPKGFWKYRSAPEVGSTRAIALMSSADPFVKETWWSRFLHKTAIGEWLLEKFWSQTEYEAAALVDFEAREGALPGFEELKSATKLRWMSGPLGLLQREDFWHVVARKVQAHHQDVARLERDALVLEDGTRIPTDVLLCGTGWIPDRQFFDSDEAMRLGLPLSLDEKTLVQAGRQRWQALEDEADQMVLRRWPCLKSSADFLKPDSRTTSYKLYNGCIPIGDHSIAFIGIVQLPNHFLAAFIQSLWAIGVLDGTLKLPSKEVLNKRIAFINAWCKRRYPVTGQLGNIFEFEMMSYLDGLLDDLHLSSHRSHKGWFADLTDPCLISDYAGLLDEYRQRYLP